MWETVPGLILAGSVGITGFGWIYCEPPRLAPKSHKRSDSETEFLLIISCLAIVAVLAYWFSDISEFAILAFGIEIGVCLFEATYLRARMSVDTMVHHVCTPVAIIGSLVRPVPLSTLAVLCGSLAAGNGVILSSKVLYTKFGSDEFKRNGLLASFLAGSLLRVLVSLAIVLMLIAEVLGDAARPDWTRLYVTAMLMLIFLNCQLVAALFQRL